MPISQIQYIREKLLHTRPPGGVRYSGMTNHLQKKRDSIEICPLDPFRVRH